MFIRSRPMSSRLKTKTLSTHPEWYVDENPDLNAEQKLPSPERWEATNDQLATLIELMREQIQATWYKDSGKTPPKLPPVIRPTTAIRELQKQYDQMAENQSAFRQMRDWAFTTGELQRREQSDQEPPGASG